MHGACYALMMSDRYTEARAPLERRPSRDEPGCSRFKRDRLVPTGAIA